METIRLKTDADEIILNLHTDEEIDQEKEDLEKTLELVEMVDLHEME